jgi:tetratricopeptide (TPR) repeat protein
MELTLRHNEHATHSLNAAFIRGNNPAVWLQEINTWQIPLTQLVCYIISQNNNPAEAAGLFVIFNKEHTPGNLLVKQPYTALGGKLYIPIDAELSPAISEKELQSLLMWHCQVMHPALGFIGFEKKDQVELSALLQYTAPKNINWEYAQAGHSPWIPLHQINVQRLTAEEVFGDIKDTIGSKPLPDIPKSNKRDVPPMLNNKIGGGILKGAFALLSGLGAIASIPGAIIGGLGGLIPSSGAAGGRSSGNGRPGFMSRIMDWMQQKIEDLERERDSELKRLTDMFEKNIDEFLQYAIPLSSPYLNRGTASPGSRLTKNPFQFNFGRLGGGRAVDGWNLDKYHNDLRNKYLMAAQQAIGKKDYKKAAYVYAHLLGDYAMAASTLKQGKHYREAAILYKDHLNNHRQAAECYEEGGLYVEAIELYTDLQEYEKAGDLYLELHQNEQALTYYEKGVDKAKLNNDYLEQSRIITDKINDRPRAKQLLLEGWQDVKQPEACLTKYFDMLAHDNKEQLHDEVKNFYSRVDLKNKKLSFLNVIDGINKKHKTTELENTCRNIAYEVVSEEVSAGNKAGLHQLKSFIANDQLLTPDCYRFIHTTKDTAAQKPVSNDVLLVKDVLWKKAMTWQNQILVWGIKPSSLVLARISSEGQVEYASWPGMPGWDEFFVAIAEPEHTNNVVLFTYGTDAADKVLVQNKYFHDQLRVVQPQFLHVNVVGIGLYNGDLITLHHEKEEAFLNTYSLTAELKASVRCSFKEQGFRVPVTNANELIRCADHYYLACDSYILRISESGDVDVLFYVQGIINKLAVRYNQYGLVTIGFYARCRAFLMSSAEDKNAEPAELGEGDVLVKDICIMSDNRYVIATEKNVRVYDGLNEEAPKVTWQFDSEVGIAAIFEGTERSQLGIVETNGEISFHVIN